MFLRSRGLACSWNKQCDSWAMCQELAQVLAMWMLSAPMTGTKVRKMSPKRRFARPKRRFGRPKRRFGRPKRRFGHPKRRFGRLKRRFGRQKCRFGHAKYRFRRPKRRFGCPKRRFGRPRRRFGRPKRYFGRPKCVSDVRNDRFGAKTDGYENRCQRRAKEGVPPSSSYGL